MHYLLYVFGLGINAIAWPLILLASSLGGRVKWQRPPDHPDEAAGLWAILPVTHWIVRAFRRFMPRWGGITLGYGGILAEDAADDPDVAGDQWTTTEEHEHIHVRWVQGLAIMSTIQAAFVLWRTGDVWTAAILWSSIWFVLVASATISAVLTGRNPYRGAVHEQAAYDGQDGHK